MFLYIADDTLSMVMFIDILSVEISFPAFIYEAMQSSTYTYTHLLSKFTLVLLVDNFFFRYNMSN